MTALNTPELALLESRCANAEHHSFSSDSSFDECQFSYHAKMHLGVKDPMGHQAVVGLAVDAAIQRIIHGKDPEIEQGLQSEIERQLRRGANRDHFRDEEMLRKAIALVKLWADEVWPTWPAIYATQMIIHATLPNGMVVHGHIDDVFRDGSFVDLKTSEKRLGDNRVHNDWQLTTYASLIWLAFGHLTPSVGLDGLIYAGPPVDVRAWNPTAKKPWYERQRGRRTLAQIESWIDVTMKREEARQWAMQTGNWQTNGRTDLFACKGCPVKPTCPAWIGTD